MAKSDSETDLVVQMRTDLAKTLKSDITTEEKEQAIHKISAFIKDNPEIANHAQFKILKQDILKAKYQLMRAEFIKAEQEKTSDVRP